MPSRRPTSVLDPRRVAAACLVVGLAVCSANRDAAAQTAASGTPASADETAALAVSPGDARPGTGSPGERIARAGTLAAVLGLALAAEGSVRGLASSWRGEVPNGLAAAGRWWGDWKSSAPFMIGGAIALSMMADPSTALERAAAIVGGTFAGSMANELVNLSLGRSRPLHDEGPWTFRPFSGHASFPSGHSAFAFALAGSVDRALDEPWLEAGVYLLAGITAYSRLHDDKHWLSDVAVGSLIGWAAGRYATGRLLSVMRVPGGAGLSLRF